MDGGGGGGKDERREGGGFKVRELNVVREKGGTNNWNKVRHCSTECASRDVILMDDWERKETEPNNSRLSIGVDDPERGCKEGILGEEPRPGTAERPASDRPQRWVPLGLGPWHAEGRTVRGLRPCVQLQGVIDVC